MVTHFLDVETEALRGEVAPLALTSNRPQGWGVLVGSRPSKLLPFHFLLSPLCVRSQSLASLPLATLIRMTDQDDEVAVKGQRCSFVPRTLRMRAFPFRAIRVYNRNRASCPICLTLAIQQLVM